ncbi:MAG: spore maturation protein [Erysipelotrichaceae bacterium]
MLVFQLIGGGIIKDIAKYLLPLLILLIVLIALIKRINAYHSFIEGVKEGLSLFSSIYPAMLAMMFAISLLRESSLLHLLTDFMKYIISDIPSEIWPMVIFRPISGSASLAILVDIFKTCGVDSIAGLMASVIQGSTDTTVYVITLYFSSVKIHKIKSSLVIGLLADVAGISVAILLSLLFLS